MKTQVLRSKFSGALIGTGVGDAPGAPFEGWYEVSTEEIEAIAEKRLVLTYTDDTHMMIGVAESLIRANGFDGDDMAQTFAKNFEREPFRGYGPGPPRVFRLIREGIAWDAAARKLYPGGSYGNGAAMRVAPIGVSYHNNLVELKEVAHKSSQITHAHNSGREGAALQACAIALAINLESALVPEVFLARLTDFVTEEVYQQKLDRMRKLLVNPDKSRVVAELGNGIEAFNSVPTAIYSFLAHPNSLAEAVLYAISLGGDADTIGAMTGAICGAYLGIGSIPDSWKSKLENRPYLEELASQLLNVKSKET